MLEAAGEGAILAGQRGPHRQWSVAVTGDRPVETSFKENVGDQLADRARTGSAAIDTAADSQPRRRWRGKRGHRRLSGDFP